MLKKLFYFRDTDIKMFSYPALKKYNLTMKPHPKVGSKVGILALPDIFIAAILYYFRL